jgi:sterol desaturase/sphingolipid hydroxylase (fatty acid hydroxylase superfamily)
MEASRRSDVLRASPRMFENELLDKLSRVHPAVPVFIFVPAIVVLLVLAAQGTGALALIGLFVGGYFFWTLAEYWIHRVVFHFEPEKGLGARLHWIIHGVHHDHPNDPMRLVMPPSVSVPLSALFCVGFWAVLGTPLWYAFGAGFLAGYLLYDMMHYFLHHHRPKSRVGKRLRELHMRHHFQDHTTGYGISAPYWDTVFRTFPNKARKDRD